MKKQRNFFFTATADLFATLSCVLGFILILSAIATFFWPETFGYAPVGSLFLLGLSLIFSGSVLGVMTDISYSVRPSPENTAGVTKKNAADPNSKTDAFRAALRK